MKLEVVGEIQEIGKISYRAFGGPGVAGDLEGSGEFFIPVSVLELQRLAGEGLLYKKAKITITFERLP